MTDCIKTHTQSEHADCLASFLPHGMLYKAKNIGGSNLRKLLLGLCDELLRVEQKMNEVCTEHDIRQTTNLIEEWERTVGIPDGCLIVASTIEERRNNVLLKLAGLGLSTAQTYVDLAAVLGITCTAGPEPGGDKFTILITFYGITAPSMWAWQWPIIWGTDPAKGLRCLFNKLKPANCVLKFVYVP